VRLHYKLWRDEATVFVISKVLEHGGYVRRIVDWRPTRSRYIRVVLPPEVRLRVRLADHRCRHRGPREFSVRYGAPGRLHLLTDFLKFWGSSPEPNLAALAQITGFRGHS